MVSGRRRRPFAMSVAVLLAAALSPRAHGAAAGQGKAVQVRGHDETSLAAPHVTGIIALGMSARQRLGKTMLTPAQVRALLVTSCKSYSSWHDPQSGFGELDAEAFFDRCLPM